MRFMGSQRLFKRFKVVSLGFQPGSFQEVQESFKGVSYRSLGCFRGSRGRFRGKFSRSDMWLLESH